MNASRHVRKISLSHMRYHSLTKMKKSAQASSLNLKEKDSYKRTRNRLVEVQT